MKASELRIGNYVWDNYSGEMIVSAIDGDYVSLRKTLDLPEGSYKVDDIHRLNLTKEWLLKFGFMKETAWFRLGIHAINPTIANLYEFKNIPIKEVDYVHQLQNLYFALTGEELTLKE